MNNKQVYYSIVLAGALSGAAAIQAAEATDPARMSNADIATCMRANIVDRGSLRDISLLATDREGKTTSLKLKLFWKPAKNSPDDRMTLQIIDPATYAGTSYLLVAKTRSQEAFLYLPALDRVQPITGGDMTQPLWGTDLTFAEVKQVQGLLLEGETKRLPDANVFERPTYVLDTVTDVEQTGYTHVKSFVDQATCTLLKSELFADGDSPRKVLEADMATLIPVEPYWLMLGYRMQDMRQGTHTELKLGEVYLLEQLPESLFTPEGFHTVQE